ncbi:MAG: hypothetical protein AVDCRST_MAG56-1810 [uncultured Cytophagales bacterium]|uniref:Uncharacterized protein n=1 Tax=uncultured Cytophagales bacterium TaxID=158755 RepID=A0A6J4IDS7_9SPHI|nr:MAG: hypothetical protein AVDCRST_MAG56-1810 [uncultured Cytophagales bacterium]
MNKYFIIGIGGTGMRCLESFVHLCAMGMFDNSEINLLALDTDLENGNFARLQELVDAYVKLKGENKAQQAHADTFFSAKINFFSFSPDYSRTETGSFQRIAKVSYAGETERDLANLLFTENVQSFDLKHGYRAQTHVGSLLMYHAILDEVNRNPGGHVSSFIDELYNANTAGNVKLFILGSVFGGTGASSIPVMPAALDTAVRKRHQGKTLDKLYIGATLLTSYFSFISPTQSSREMQRVVADSKNFSMNSQAAMMFYEDDLSVKRAYQKFYMLGTATNDFKTEQAEPDTITGGARQRNDSHYIELFAAFAAYDFFKTPDSDLQKIKADKNGVQYFFRTMDESGKLDFKDFLPEHESAGGFMKRFSLLTAMSFLVNLDNTDFFASAQRGELKNISGYEDITKVELDAVYKYFGLYHFRLSNDQVREGWLRQLYRSTGGGDRLMFSPEMFGLTTARDFRKYDYGKLFPKNSEYNRHNFNSGLFSNPFDKFKEAFVRETTDSPFANKSEKLIKRMYDALGKLYGF